MPIPPLAFTPPLGWTKVAMRYIPHTKAARSSRSDDPWFLPRLSRNRKSRHNHSGLTRISPSLHRCASAAETCQLLLVCSKERQRCLGLSQRGRIQHRSHQSHLLPAGLLVCCLSQLCYPITPQVKHTALVGHPPKSQLKIACKPLGPVARYSTQLLQHKPRVSCSLKESLPGCGTAFSF